MAAKTYDPACYDLAEHFLQDEPCRKDAVLMFKHSESLARAIQQAVEDWFFEDGMDNADSPQDTNAKDADHG